jgi:hypothetical protein
MPVLKTFTPQQVYHYDCMMVLEYDTRYELMYALARFQEYYENPVLKNKFFTRTELQELSPDYYVSWNGCNFPPRVVDAISHDPLWVAGLDRHEEAALAEMPKGMYIVGCHREILGGAPPEWSLDERRRAVLRHEYAHALYATSKSYRKSIGKAVPKGFEDVAARLRDMGYDDAVIVDEMQAYTFSGWDRLKLEPHVQRPLEFMVAQDGIGEMQAVRRKDWAPWAKKAGQTA